MSRLIDCSIMKTAWGIEQSDSSQDRLIDMLIGQCSARIERYCGRTFAVGEYTEQLEGSGTVYVCTKNRPILSITNLWLDLEAWWTDHAFGSSTLLVEGQDYVIDRDQVGGTGGAAGMVRRINDVWPKPGIYRPGVISPTKLWPQRCIKIVYRAGFLSIPEDVQQACMLLCSSVRAIAGTGGKLQSEGYEDYNYALASAVGKAWAGMPSDTLGALGPYRNWPVG